MTKIVVIDAGHGGHDPGAMGHGLKEKDLTLKIALKIRDLAKNVQGLKVVLTRDTDKFIHLTERANIANRNKADLFVSIHNNAFNGKALGYEDYRHISTQGRTESYHRIIHKHVSKNFAVNRGLKTNSYTVLGKTNMPAILTENGFIDSPVDAGNLKSDKYLNDIAQSHVDGILEIFNLKQTNTTKPSQPTKPTQNNTSGQKYIEVITPTLKTYKTANFDDYSTTVTKKGEVFTVKRGKFKVGRGYMYELKSGLFISAAPSYVREFTK